MPATLGIDVVDTQGTTGSTQSGRIAQRCDAKAEGLARTVYLDPLRPPAAPSRLKTAMTEKCRRGDCTRFQRLSWDDVSGETGYRIYVVYDWWGERTRDGKCELVVGQTSKRLLATVGADVTSYTTKLYPDVPPRDVRGYGIDGGIYYIAAFNEAGESRQVASRRWHDGHGYCGF